LKFIAAHPKANPMKSQFYLLSLTLLLSFCIELHAQGTSALTSSLTTGHATDYGYDAPTETTAKRELSKRERQRFQRSLVRRGDELADWDLELENREMILNGRGARGRRALSRNPLPARLLKTEDLYAWETRLDRRAARLRSKDLLLQERERRVLRHRVLLERSAHTRRPSNGTCVQECCRPAKKQACLQASDQRL